MNQLSEFIESGILELYVMGIASSDEVLEVEQMAQAHPQIRQEIEQISLGLEEYAIAQAVQPKATLKPLVMATIDYIERMKNGEPFVQAPVLSEASRPEDFAPWLEQEAFKAPAVLEGAFAKVISATPQMSTALVWIQNSTDREVHTDEYEHFLILEGTCDFIVGDKTYSLVPGDYLGIPLHVPHLAKVTSNIPCKAILQRVAA